MTESILTMSFNIIILFFNLWLYERPYIKQPESINIPPIYPDIFLPPHIFPILQLS